MWVNIFRFSRVCLRLKFPPSGVSIFTLRSLSADPAGPCVRKITEREREKCFDNKFSRRARVKGSHIYPTPSSSFAYSFLSHFPFLFSQLFWKERNCWHDTEIDLGLGGLMDDWQLGNNPSWYSLEAHHQPSANQKIRENESKGELKENFFWERFVVSSHIIANWEMRKNRRNIRNLFMRRASFLFFS